jgi:predicted TIM-barrel fold metal-dependent hydrolase
VKIVGLEEHIVLPQLLDAWSKLPGVPQIPELVYGDAPIALRLRDKGSRRLADMDDQGVDMQVLSLSTPGVQNLAPKDAVIVAREMNDALAEIVVHNPNRFQAFAAVPTPAPEAAAAELERAITQLGCRGAMLYGRTGTVHADAPQFDDLYSVAERLGAPLYFHPQTPVRPVLDAYYAGINPTVDFMFATFGVGWYYDLGVQLLRLIFSGVLDRHPNLQVIVGHWGELVLFYLDHIASMQTLGLHLQRPLAHYFRQNIWVTGSGTLSERYLRWTAEVVGTDRMLYACDYPFTYATGDPIVETSGGRARSFLERAPLTDQERIAIASGNWERLTAHLTAKSRSAAS